MFRSTALLQSRSLALLVALAALGACHKSGAGGGGNVALRDMAVVDGTANDAMTDLDNATADGTLLSDNGVEAVPAAPTDRKAPADSSTTTPAASGGNSSAAAPD